MGLVNSARQARLSFSNQSRFIPRLDLIAEKPSTELSRASPNSTAAFHKFLRDGGISEKDEELASIGEQTDGIDFIQALSDRGENELVRGQERGMLDTKARLFGDD